MNYFKRYVSVIAAAGLTTLSSQAQETLNFSSSPGSSIQFNGVLNSFQFNPSTFTGLGGVYFGSQWFVGNENGGTGSAVGLFGEVANGPFTYGPITVSGSEQTASVLGPLGGLQVNDGSGFNLTGVVNWIQVQTFDYSGALNASLVVNVTSLNYSGSNPDLQSLVASGLGAMNLSFQFAPGETLSQLSTGSTPFTTSYSGSISTVPEPASISLFCLGLGAVALPRLFRGHSTVKQSTPSKDQ